MSAEYTTGLVLGSLMTLGVMLLMSIPLADWHAEVSQR